MKSASREQRRESVETFALECTGRVRQLTTVLATWYSHAECLEGEANYDAAAAALARLVCSLKPRLLGDLLIFINGFRPKMLASL